MAILRMTFLVCMTLIFGGAALFAARPELIDELSLRNLSSNERARVEHIRRLAISNEKRQILISGNIFMGAGAHMVELSIGEPRFVTIQPTEGRDGVEVWGYHFEQDGRPTLLEFSENRLVNAYKSSYIDIERQYGSLVMRK